MNVNFTTSKSEDNPIANQQKCFGCKSITKVQACARCNLAFYCSKPCQRSHWQKHKVACDIDFQIQNPIDLTELSVKKQIYEGKVEQRNNFSMTAADLKELFLEGDQIILGFKKFRGKCEAIINAINSLPPEEYDGQIPTLARYMVYKDSFLIMIDKITICQAEVNRLYELAQKHESSND